MRQRNLLIGSIRFEPRTAALLPRRDIRKQIPTNKDKLSVGTFTGWNYISEIPLKPSANLRIKKAKFFAEASTGRDAASPEITFRQREKYEKDQNRIMQVHQCAAERLPFDIGCTLGFRKEST